MRDLFPGIVLQKINLVKNVRLSAAVANWRRRETEKEIGVEPMSGQNE